MVKINGFLLEHWDHNNQWFIQYPNGYGVSLPDKYSFRVVLRELLYIIQKDSLLKWRKFQNSKKDFGLRTKEEFDESIKNVPPQGWWY